MKLELIGREYQIDDKLKTLLEKKLKRLDKYFAPDAPAKLVITQTGNDCGMDLTIFADKTVRAEASGKDAYKVIDLIVPRVKRQFRKEHTRKIAKREK